MSQLIVEDENGTRKLPLKRGSSRVGSGPECELRLEHGEVQQVALMLNLRDESLTVANYNPYSVYLGDRELPTGETISWPSNMPLRMTRSITLTYEANGSATVAQPKTVDDEEKPASSAKKKLMQAGVILFCVLVGLTQMNPKEPAAAERSDLNFDILRERIDATIKDNRLNSRALHDWRTVRRLLQEAEYLSFRPSEINNKTKIAAYQLILDHDLISNPKPDDKLPMDVNQYATMRKEQLSSGRR